MDEHNTSNVTTSKTHSPLLNAKAKDPSAKERTPKKYIINLLLGIFGTMVYGYWFLMVLVLIGMFGTGTDVLFCLVTLAVGGVGSVILTCFSFSKNLPFRVDSLFILLSLFIRDETFRDFFLVIPVFVELIIIIWLCLRFVIRKGPVPPTKTELHQPARSSNVMTPLLSAIISQNTDSVRAALAEHPQDLNTAYAQNGNTPLHVAALNGQAEIVKLLLAQPGLDKTRQNNDGKTALDLAQEKNLTEIAELLKGE